MSKWMNLTTIFLIFVWSTSIASPVGSIYIPDYQYNPHPHCSCNCENKIIFRNEPISQSSLNIWSKEAITTAFSFGYGNYNAALKRASQYFTEDGWENFREALLTSGNLDLVIKKKLIMTAIPSGEPEVRELYNENKGIYWQIKIPVVLKYESTDRTQHERYVVTINVIKHQDTSSVQGLGIQQFIVEKAPNSATA